MKNHPFIKTLHDYTKIIERHWKQSLKEFQSGTISDRPAILSDLKELKGILPRLQDFLSFGRYYLFNLRIKAFKWYVSALGIKLKKTALKAVNYMFNYKKS